MQAGGVGHSGKGMSVGKVSIQHAGRGRGTGIVISSLLLHTKWARKGMAGRVGKVCMGVWGGEEGQRVWGRGQVRQW